MTRARHDPIRTCVGCGERGSQGSLLRLGPGRGDAIEPSAASAGGAAGQPAPRGPGQPPRIGRGAYVHPRPDCIEALRKSKRLGRTLRRPIERSDRDRIADACMRHLADRIPAGRRPRAPLRGLATMVERQDKA